MHQAQQTTGREEAVRTLYLAKPKKDGKPRKGGFLRYFEPSEGFKVERKKNWEILFR